MRNLKNSRAWRYVTTLFVFVLILHSCTYQDASCQNSDPSCNPFVSWLLFSPFPTARFVVAGNEGLGLYSDDGTNWAQSNIAFNTNITLWKVIWTGSRFVAVGTDADVNQAAIFYSTNGKFWVRASIPTNCSGNSTLEDVVLGAGRLMAVGAAGSSAACALTSTDDGSSWTQVNTGAAITPFQKVAYDGTVFMGANSVPGTGFGFGALSWISTDASTFAYTGGSIRNGGTPIPVTGDFTAVGTTIVFVGVDNGGNSESAFTLNSGSAWGGGTGPLFGPSAVNYPRAIIPNSGLTFVVVVGDNCFYDIANNPATFNWSIGGAAISGCSNVNFKDMIFETSSSTFYAVGQNSGMALWNTTDGLAWNEISTSTMIVPNSIASSR